MQAFHAWRSARQSPLQAVVFTAEHLAGKWGGVLQAAAMSTSAPRGPLSSLADFMTATPDPQYPTHVPLTKLQKGALAAIASLGAFANPRRADLVAVVGETTGVSALRAIRDRMRRSPEGQELLALRPRVTDESVAHAWDLPPGTFGGAYAQFMGKRGFRADERPAVRFVDDPELAWVAARAREVHDFWHVLFGCGTDVFGEAALKAVEFMQTGLPMTAMAVVAGEWRLKPEDRKLMNEVYLPWALRAGAGAADLVTLHYEKHFEEDLEELRRRWRIIPAPTVRAEMRRATKAAGSGGEGPGPVAAA